MLGQDKTKEQLIAELAALRQKVNAANQTELHHRLFDDEFHKINRALKTFIACNQALLSAKDEIELLNTICLNSLSAGGYRLAWVGFAEQDENKTIRPVAQAGYEAGYLEFINITWADTERGRGPTGTAIRTGKPFIVNNILTDGRFALWRTEAHKRGYASVLGLPLNAGSHTFGALTIYASDQDAFKDQEVSLLMELANCLAYGILSLRSRAEQKRVEAALHVSEDRFSSIVNTTTDAVLIADESGTLLYVNPSAERLLGYTAAELLGKSLEILRPERYRAGVKNYRDILMKTGSSPFVGKLAERVALKKDGSEFHVEISTSCWETNDQFFFSGIIRDITKRKHLEQELGKYRYSLEEQVSARTAELIEANINLQQEIAHQKQTEETLRISEEKYRSVIETASDAIININSEGEIIAWNQSAVQLFGYSADEIINKPFLTLLPERFHSFQLHKLQDFIEDKNNSALVRHGEIVGKRKDGSEFPVEGSTSKWRTKEGSFATTIARDITKRKQTEQALRESEDKFRTMTENISSAIFIYQDNHLVYANPAAEKISGYSCVALQNMNFWDFIHPDFKEQVKEWGFKRQAGEELPLHYELKIINKNGEARWIDYYTAPAINYNGRKAVLGTAVDITDRKLAENLFKQSEERYRLIADNIPIHLGAIDRSGKYILWNKYSEKIFGYTQDEVINKIYPITIHESKEDAEAVIRIATETGIYDNNVNLRKKDGTLFPAHLVVVPDHYQGEGINCYYGFAEDITIRKRAEDLITKVNNCLLSLSPDPDKNIQAIVEVAGTILRGASATYHKKQGAFLITKANWNIPTELIKSHPWKAKVYLDILSAYGGDPFIISNIDEIPFIPKDSFMLTLPFKSFIAAPIKSNNKLIGSLNISYKTPETFTQNELNTLSILARAIAIEEERKRALDELNKNQQKLRNSERNLKAFSGKILTIREEEKKYISSSLHDEIGSMVVALSSCLTITKDEIIENNLEQALKSLAKTEAILKHSVNNLKKVVIDLRPPTLDIVGLPTALRNYCTNISQQTGIAINGDFDVDDKIIPEDRAIVIYRICQESLNNVIKHAKASAITIRLEVDKKNLHFKLSDNGRGFDVKSLNAVLKDPQKVGVQGMKERIESLGGTFVIESVPNKGTSVYATIPYC